MFRFFLSIAHSCISIRAYLVISTFFLSILGYSQALEAVGLTYSVRRPVNIIQLMLITCDRITGPIWCHS
jgi:hypothetical protein